MGSESWSRDAQSREQRRLRNCHGLVTVVSPQVVFPNSAGHAAWIYGQQLQEQSTDAEKAHPRQSVQNLSCAHRHNLRAGTLSSPHTAQGPASRGGPTKALGWWEERGRLVSKQANLDLIAACACDGAAIG